MKEVDFVGNILVACDKVMPGGKGFKHHDTVTSGIPDFSWSWAQRTIWAEVKYGSTAKVSPIQRYTLQRLDRVTLALIIWGKPELATIEISTAKEVLLVNCSNAPHVARYLRRRIEEWNAS